ncbi:MAG: hypothetical protein ABIC36_00990 [bacterium]
MKDIKIQVSRQYFKKKDELNRMIKKYHPVLLLQEFTGRKWNKELFVKHKDLGLGAAWDKENIILVNFKNDVHYSWLGICHELAHLMLRNPPWHHHIQIKKIIDKYNDYQSDKYHYDFCYAIEQTLAFFLQAACENRAGLRRLKWEQWQDTFRANDVLEFAQKLWKDWLKYLKNISRYKKIDEWILEELEKYWA